MDVSASAFVGTTEKVEASIMAGHSWPIVLRIKTNNPLGGPASVNLHFSLAKAEEAIAALQQRVNTMRATAKPPLPPVTAGALSPEGLGDVHNLEQGDRE